MLLWYVKALISISKLFLIVYNNIFYCSRYHKSFSRLYLKVIKNKRELYENMTGHIIIWYIDYLRLYILYTFSRFSLSFKQQFTNGLMLHFWIREGVNYIKSVTFPLNHCFCRGQPNGLSQVPHYYDHHVLFCFYILLVDLTLRITLQIYQWQCRFHIFTAAIRSWWIMSMELLPTWKNINR